MLARFNWVFCLKAKVQARHPGHVLTQRLSWGRIAFRFAGVVGRIHFLVVVGLRQQPLGSAGGRPQPLATWAPCSARKAPGERPIAEQSFT